MLKLLWVFTVQINDSGPSSSKRRYFNELVKGHFVKCFSRFNALQKLLTFFSKKFQHICVWPDVNFNESLIKDTISFEQLGPGKFEVETWSFHIGPFIPEFLKWILSSLNLVRTNAPNRGLSHKSKQISNSVDPDEMARYEPSHLDLHCLHMYLFWSPRLNGLI